MQGDGPSGRRLPWLLLHAGLGSLAAGCAWLWLSGGGSGLPGSSLLGPVAAGAGIAPLLLAPALAVTGPWWSGRGARRAWLSAAAALAAGAGILEPFLSGASRQAVAGLLVGTLAFAMMAGHAAANARREAAPPRGALLAWSGMAAGAAAAALLGGLAWVPLALLLAALLLAGSAWFPGADGLPAADPGLHSERAAARWFRLESLLRHDASLRLPLLLQGCLCGSFAVALSLVPMGWELPEVGEASGGTGLISLGLALAGFLAGAAAGSSGRQFPRLSRSRGAVLAWSLASGASLLALALAPGWGALLSPLAGYPLGLGLRACRDELLLGLSRHGASMEVEAEAAARAARGGGVAAVAGSSWLMLSATDSAAAALLPLATAVAAAAWAMGHRRMEPGAGEDPPLFPRRPGSGGTLYFPGVASGGFLPDPSAPLAVSILYEIPPENQAAFATAAAKLGRVRRRQGAMHWSLSRDSGQPTRYTENYWLESWEDYQQAIRQESREDKAAKQKVFDLNDWDSLPRETRGELLGE